MLLPTATLCSVARLKQARKVSKPRSSETTLPKKSLLWDGLAQLSCAFHT
jgi:hypothetical protein